MSVFSDIFQSQQIEDAVVAFPATFAKAQEDWAKFKVGYQAGLFSSSQIESVLSWYRDFPKLWATIRPNFEDIMAEQVGQYNVNFIPTVDAWLASIKADPVYQSGLGQVQAVLIGAVLIVGGIAAGVWALGYLKEQSNISGLIDGVTAGKIPASTLADAIAKEKTGNPITDITGVIKWVAIGFVVIMALPPLLKMFESRQSRQVQHA